MSNGTKVSLFDTINDYLSELKAASVLVKFDDDQYRKYCYKPKLLCYDIYGNPELYFIILLMNDMADVKEFNKKTAYMLPKNYMSILTSYIYNSEKSAIDSYNTKYSD
uniref:Baseplate wedge protein n=1 Tax=Myoviridae sp. ctwwN25 TaxID=2825209 RepID=A0A8S5PQS5_9CAUD|nr:MAG TPA: baseplate wedge protein [Myoviridae sp. ctwwN25]